MESIHTLISEVFNASKDLKMHTKGAYNWYYSQVSDGSWIIVTFEPLNNSIRTTEDDYSFRWHDMAFARIDDDKVNAEITELHNEGNSEKSIFRLFQEHATDAKTGMGKPIEVFGIVSSALKDFKKNMGAKADLITFGSIKSEPSRVKLYNKLAKRVDKNYRTNVEFFDNTGLDDPKSVETFIVSLDGDNYQFNRFDKAMSEEPAKKKKKKKPRIIIPARR